jgi:hypothetical protein
MLPKHVKLGSAKRFPAAFWGIAYLVLIPLFAAIYVRLPDEFYHYTAKYELVVTEEKNVLSRAIESVLRNKKQTYRRTVPDKNGAQTINFDGIRVNLLNIEENIVRFSVQVPILMLWESGPIGPEALSFYELLECVVEVPTSEIAMRMPVAVARLTIKEPFDPAVALALFNGDPQRPTATRTNETNQQGKSLTDAKSNRLVSYYFQLFLPRESWDRANRIRRANLGFPAEVKNQFARMLYLSAITITTTGYGDIVPISDKARWFITLESVLGIVVMGLFVNSLLPGGLRKSQTGQD